MNQGPNVQTYLVVIVNIGANMVCAGGVQVYPYLFISSNKKISQDQDNDHKYEGGSTDKFTQALAL